MSVDAEAIWYDLRFSPCDRRTYGTGHREPRRRVSRPISRVRPEPEVRLEQQIREEESRDS
jgi:hypothetical protein